MYKKKHIIPYTVSELDTSWYFLFILARNIPLPSDYDIVVICRGDDLITYKLAFYRDFTIFEI